MAITVVIPTHTGRHPYLKRALHYYESVSFPYPIVVSDSSPPEEQRENEALTTRTRLTITHRAFSANADFFLKMTRTLACITTAYVVISSTDDFIFSGALDPCVAFLEDHRDYSVVGGREFEVVVSTDAQCSTSRVEGGEIFQKDSIESARPQKRLRTHFARYSPTFYGVHRTALLYHSLRKAQALEADLFLAELLASGLTLLQGKCQYLDRLFMARQIHSSSVGKSLPSLAEATREASFPDRLKQVRDALATDMHELYGMDRTRAERCAERAISDYLRAQLDSSPGRVRQVLGRIKRVVLSLRDVAGLLTHGGTGAMTRLRSPENLFRDAWAQRRERKLGKWSVNQLLDAANGSSALQAVWEEVHRWPTGRR